MLLRNVKLCLRHSEIIHYADSEITAACGGSDEEWQPKGLRNSITASKASHFTGSQIRFHPAQAGFHSARLGRISLLILNSEIARSGSEIHGWSHERNYPLCR